MWNCCQYVHAAPEVARYAGYYNDLSPLCHQADNEKSRTTYQACGYGRKTSSTALVYSKFNLPKAEDTKATLSIFVFNDINVYDTMTSD